MQRIDIFHEPYVILYKNFDGKFSFVISFCACPPSPDHLQHTHTRRILMNRQDFWQRDLCLIRVVAL